MSKRSKKSSKKGAAPQGAAAPSVPPVQPARATTIEEPPAPAPAALAPPLQVSVAAQLAEQAQGVPAPAVADDKATLPHFDGSELRWCGIVATAAVAVFAVLALAHGNGAAHRHSPTGSVPPHPAPASNLSQK